MTGTGESGMTCRFCIEQLREEMTASLTSQGDTRRGYLNEDICSNDHFVEKHKIMTQNNCIRISGTIYIQLQFTLKLYLKQPLISRQ